jgi:hypothetical protein
LKFKHLTAQAFSLAGRNQPKSLSGIETRDCQSPFAFAVLAWVGINLNPYQGLKQEFFGSFAVAISASRNQPKSLSGIETQFRRVAARSFADSSRNQPKSLSGIETLVMQPFDIITTPEST